LTTTSAGAAVAKSGTQRQSGRDVCVPADGVGMWCAGRRVGRFIGARPVGTRDSATFPHTRRRRRRTRLTMQPASCQAIGIFQPYYIITRRARVRVCVRVRARMYIVMYSLTRTYEFTRVCAHAGTHTHTHTRARRIGTYRYVCTCDGHHCRRHYHSFWPTARLPPPPLLFVQDLPRAFVGK